MDLFYIGYNSDKNHYYMRPEATVAFFLILVAIFLWNLSSASKYGILQTWRWAWAQLYGASLWRFIINSLFPYSITQSGSDPCDCSFGGACNAMPVEELNMIYRIRKRKLDDFPVEILINIFSHLSAVDVLKTKLLSRSMCEAVSNECIWKQMWMNSFSSMWSDPNIKKIRLERNIIWDPTILPCRSPTQGWFLYYVLFDICWVDWLLAGYCTKSRSLIGYDRSILDVTNFVDYHPGSAETLSEEAGGDVTERFIDIGHSSYALALMDKMYVWNNRNSKRREASKSGTTEVSKLQVHLTAIRQDISTFATKRANAKATQPKGKECLKAVAPSTATSAGDFVVETIKKTRKNLYCSSYLDNARAMVPCITDYAQCATTQDHFGQAKTFFDPLHQEFNVWWTCCGIGHVLKQ